MADAIFSLDITLDVRTDRLHFLTFCNQREREILSQTNARERERDKISQRQDPSTRYEFSSSFYIFHACLPFCLLQPLSASTICDYRMCCRGANGAALSHPTVFIPTHSSSSCHVFYFFFNYFFLSPCSSLGSWFSAPMAKKQKNKKSLLAIKPFHFFFIFFFFRSLISSYSSTSFFTSLFSSHTHTHVMSFIFISLWQLFFLSISLSICFFFIPSFLSLTTLKLHPKEPSDGEKETVYMLYKYTGYIAINSGGVFHLLGRAEMVYCT